jgi:outer membrane biosynthesis protein TonB
MMTDSAVRSWPLAGAAMFMAASASAQSGHIEPPRIQTRTLTQESQVSRCYSHFARNSGQMGRVVARVTIEPDGRPSEVSFPPGIEDWQERTARCVVQVLSYEPATKDGVPVAAEVAMPFVFTLEGSGKISHLEVASTDEEVERALRDCYPADAISIAEPAFRVTVSRRGKAVDVELVESSGDESLDRAGACLLQAIDFQPTMRGNQPISSTAIIPVTVRPPKQAATGNSQP